MRKFTRQIKRCPRCSGVILVQQWYHYAENHRLSQAKGTVLTYQDSRTAPEAAGTTTAFCENCGLRWDQGEFFVDQNRWFWDQKYGKELPGE